MPVRNLCAPSPASQRSATILVLMALATGMLVPAAALAAPHTEAARPLDVDTRGCVFVNAEQLRPLLVLDLGVERHVPALQVALVCDRGRAEIRVVNTDTHELATRTITLSPAQPEAERLVAVAASQLVIAVWLERTQAPQAKLASLPSRGSDDAPRPPPVSKPSTRHVAIELLGGARARNPPAFAAGPLAGVQASFWQGHVAPRLKLTIERGSAELALGSAQLTIAEFAVGAAWRSSTRADLAVQLGVFGAIAAVRLSGQTTRGDVSAGSVQGVTADMGVDGALVLALGSLRLGATLGGGYLPMSAVGVVSDGTTLSPQGLWAGLGFSVGGAL